MQQHIQRAAAVAAVLAVGVLLGGCDGPRKVSGNLDVTRHVAATTSKRTRPHMVSRCHTGTKRVRHTSGRGRNKRTWYTDEPTRVCSQVRQGTETYQHVDRPERWCVRLDDVGGKESRDNVWYRVSRNVYQDARLLRPGSSMTFSPDHDGC